MDTVQFTQMVTQLIGSLGFPIVACFYMAKINREQSARHHSEMEAATEALNKLDNSITILNERLGGKI